MADRKNRFALISGFEKHYRINGMTKPEINKYGEQWAADALLESFEVDDLKDAIEYYFYISHRPTWKGFANNADKLINAVRIKKEDDALRAQMRIKAKEWMNESRG